VLETYPLLTDCTWAAKARRWGSPGGIPLLHSAAAAPPDRPDGGCVDRPYILQGGPSNGDPIEGIDGIEILEASPL